MDNTAAYPLNAEYCRLHGVAARQSPQIHALESNKVDAICRVSNGSLCKSGGTGSCVMNYLCCEGRVAGRCTARRPALQTSEPGGQITKPTPRTVVKLISITPELYSMATKVKPNSGLCRLLQGPGYKVSCDMSQGALHERLSLA